jgi:hypothetical protein
MEPARRITDDDELRSIAAAGIGLIIDPFNRRWHLAACPHVHTMTTGQPKWLARSSAELDDYLRRRHVQYPAAKPILPCPACGNGTGLAPPAAEPSARYQGADRSDGHPVKVRAALRQVISEHGPEALSRPSQLANLMKDLLPDDPAISRMLVAAAEEHIADQLRDQASTGIDDATAIRLAAASFASRTMFDLGTCTWLIRELATALGLTTDDGYTPTVTASTPPPHAAAAVPSASIAEDRDDSQARAMLEILKASGDAASLQTIYDGLRALGYVPHTPVPRQPGNRPEQYLRWTDPTRGGPAVIYFKKADLWFVRTEDLTTLSDLPAGTTTLGGRQHNVRFPVTPHASGEILQGAQRLKR